MNRKPRRIGRPQKHGAFSIITKGGELPEKRGYLRDYLESVRAGLISDLGPLESDLSTGRRVLVDRAISILGVIRCIEEHIGEGGVFQGGQLAPVLQKNYLAFVNSFRQIVEVLGLERRAGAAIDVLAYAKEFDEADAMLAKLLDRQPETPKAEKESLSETQKYDVDRIMEFFRKYSSEGKPESSEEPDLPDDISEPRGKKP